MISTMLCAFVAAAPLSPAAFAQSRAASGLPGLPSEPGNPIAQLQQQIDALAQQVAGLGSQVAALGTPGGGLGVYDAKENRIGDVIGVQDNIPWVGLTTAGHVVALQVFPDQLIGAFLWYTDTNCTGDLYISGNVVGRGPNVFSVAAVQEPGGVVYAAEAGAEAQAVRVRSVLQHDGTCYTYSASINQNVLPATQLMTLDTVFTRPYSVR